MTNSPSALGVLAPLLEQGFSGFRSDDPVAILRELADREEIRELTARYAFLVANKRSAAELFTDDGGFIFRKPDGEVGVARGRSALGDVFEDILRAPNHNLPTVHNHLLSIEGDEATGVCWIELHAHKDGEDWRGAGYYEDVFRRENGRWKFVLRDSTLVKWQLERS
jgi:hypothetical protein